MANVNEGDRLAFVTHVVSKLCYLIRLVNRVQRFVCIFEGSPIIFSIFTRVQRVRHWGEGVNSNVRFTKMCVLNIG